MGENVGAAVVGENVGAAVVGENVGAAVPAVGVAVLGAVLGAGENVGEMSTHPSQSRSAWQLSSGRQSGQHVVEQPLMTG